VSEDCTLWQAFGFRVGSWGFANVCNVGGVSFFFLRVGRKKQNKFSTYLHCPVKKLNPFLFSFYRYRFCLFVCLFTLVANVQVYSFFQSANLNMIRGSIIFHTKGTCQLPCTKLGQIKSLCLEFCSLSLVVFRLRQMFLMLGNTQASLVLHSLNRNIPARQSIKLRLAFALA